MVRVTAITDPATAGMPTTAMAPAGQGYSADGYGRLRRRGPFGSGAYYDEPGYYGALRPGYGDGMGPSAGLR
jgi:hypothetical protein